MTHRNFRYQKAFTIVELLVVIVVIGVLASISLVAYTGISKKAKEAAITSDLTNTSKRLKLHQVENSAYPSDSTKLTNCPTPVAGSICLKLSPGDTLGAYTVNNSVSPQTFCLTIKNGVSMVKHIDQDGVINDDACSYNFPSTLSATGTAPTSTAIYLSWLTISGTIDSYTLERATDNAFTLNKTTLTAPTPAALTYTSSTLTPATSYFYHIKVTIDGDTSNWSNVATNTTKATLTVTAGANGTVNTAVNGDYISSATPTITATPNGGYSFSSWSGSTGCAGTASHTITMDSVKACTANFVLNPTLTISAGAGGTVNTGVNGSYVINTIVTITASPGFPYVFSSWSGSTGCAGTASHTMTMDAVKTCTANFTLDSNWYAGVGGLAGKYVYKTDAPGTYSWDVGSPGFTAGCVAGGRWPNLTELQAMYTDNASYGTFQTDLYRASTKTGIYTDFVYFPTDGRTLGDSATWRLYYVRCIAG